MDMSWQALLHKAAAVSFEKNAETLAAVDNNDCFSVDLHNRKSMS